MNNLIIEEIRILLGAASDNFTDAVINLAFKTAVNEVELYTGRAALDDSLTLIAERIAVIKLGRIGTDGITSQSFSGVSENFIDGYPQEIQNILNRKRKIKVI